MSHKEDNPRKKKKDPLFTIQRLSITPSIKSENYVDMFTKGRKEHLKSINDNQTKLPVF